MSTLIYTTTLVAMNCGVCGTPFALAEDFIAQRQKDHATWYCPNGHSRYYPGESKEEALARQLKNAQDRASRLVAERDQLEASRRAWKGQVTRLRKRTIEGECPLCGQHLRDLARHVGRVHPGETVELAEAEA